MSNGPVTELLSHAPMQTYSFACLFRFCNSRKKNLKVTVLKPGNKVKRCK